MNVPLDMVLTARDLDMIVAEQYHLNNEYQNSRNRVASWGAAFAERITELGTADGHDR